MFTRKTKIISITVFDQSTRHVPTFISGTFNSTISCLKKNGEADDWLIKRPQDDNDSEGGRYEVFSAWQFEVFMDSNAQPEYYLVTEGDSESVATKVIVAYKSLNQMLRAGNNEEETLINTANNLKLLAQLLINYLWLAASDLKLDHIGVDADNTLVCLDFGESLIPFRYEPHAYARRQWDFSITSNDLFNAPFFHTYKASNYFTDRVQATPAYQNRFDYLQDSILLRQELCHAVFKRCIFPNFITFTALEVFAEYDDECANELALFLNGRTLALYLAAFQNRLFLDFIIQQGVRAYARIRTEILGDDALQNKPYFRGNKSKFLQICMRTLDLNFGKIFSLAQKTTETEPSVQGVSVLTLLNILRDFCFTEYKRLQVAEKASFFKKGIKDKIDLYAHLLNRIDDLNFSEPSERLQILVENLIREVGIVAHHRRYSKINTFFNHTTSTSWRAFRDKFSSYPDTENYYEVVRTVLENPQARSVPSLQNGAMISVYNDYRSDVRGNVTDLEEARAANLHLIFTP